MAQIATYKMVNGSGNTVEVPLFELSDVDNDFFRGVDPNGNIGAFNAVSNSKGNLPIKIVDGSGSTYRLRDVTYDVIDDFEDGNLSEYDEEYDGGASITSSAIQGNYCVELDADGGSIASTGGLDNYPSRGDKFRFWVYPSSFAQYGFAYQGNLNGRYSIDLLAGDNDFQIRYDAVNLISETSISMSQNTWYEVEVDFQSIITAKLYNSNGGFLGSVSGSDTRYNSGGIVYYGDKGSRYDFSRIIN